MLEEDLPRIEAGPREQILRAIRTRLGTAPESYGKPLAGKLAGCRRLRVGDYRVVYQIENQRIIVTIICIGARRDEEVYAEAARRMDRR